MNDAAPVNEEFVQQIRVGIMTDYTTELNRYAVIWHPILLSKQLQILAWDAAI